MNNGIHSSKAPAGSVTDWQQKIRAAIRPMGLLGPAGVWLFLLMVLPALLIGELSLVPGLRPGQVIDGYGLLNYLRILEPTYLQVLRRSATFAVGLGANVLVGGSNKSFALQPVSIQTQTGLNVAAGVTELELRSIEGE